MSTWNTGHHAHLAPKQPVTTGHPTQHQLESFYNKYLDKMNLFFVEFYQEYARLYNSNIHQFIFPQVEEILDQFGNYLKLRRGPELPKPVMMKQSMTYGEFKRNNDSDYGASYFNNDNADNPASKKPRIDDGWGDEELTPAVSTVAISNENNSGWNRGARRDFGNSDTPRESNFRGRGRGGRGRGGGFRGSRNNNRFDNRDRNSDNGWGGGNRSGGNNWGRNEDSASSKPKGWADDDGWNDSPADTSDKKTAIIPTTSTDDWDDDPPAAVKKPGEPKKQAAGDDEWDNDTSASTQLTQDTSNWVIDTQYMSESTVNETIKTTAGKDDDDWDQR